MARVIALDDIEHKLKQSIVSILRVCDEAVVLPQAHRSMESGVIKNVVMRLNGVEEGLNPDIFSPMWFSGVSVISFPSDKAEALLSSDAKRREVIERLAKSVPSEMQDAQIQVGPDLDGDDQDRDTAKWEAGFDGPGCCVGLYSAMQNRAPDAHLTGMSRVHKSYYLVCKAGAGLAGQTFHARLSAALKSGSTLDDALSDEGSPGAKALRRVSVAAKRNRCRILNIAAQSLGFVCVDTIGDNASPLSSPYRVAIPAIDCCYNALVKVDNGARSTWQYTSGCVESSVSLGAITSSNVAEGFVAFTTSTGDLRYAVRNDAHGVIPFSTQRILSNRDAVFKATEEHKKSKGVRQRAHPDHDWVSSHFGWHSKSFDGTPEGVDIEPHGVWGSHESENFVSEWSRELGIARASVLRLQPELVALSAVEPGKLRVAVKALAR
tara:strand:+ start:10178 stop:11485 length:1308 start_codon:yes stop_codon:yes gene_type:complete